MGDFTPAEEERNLYLVPLFEEPFDIPELELKIMVFGPRPDFDFLYMNNGLVFLRFLAPLVLLVFIFPVIHDPADRRRSSRGDLHQIQTLFLGEPDGLFDGQNPDLFSVGIDDPHFRRPDLSVDVGFLNYTIHLL